MFAGSAAKEVTGAGDSLAAQATKPQQSSCGSEYQMTIRAAYRSATGVCRWRTYFIAKLNRNS